MTALRSSHGKEVHDNLDAQGTLAFLQRIADTGLISNPVRVRLVPENNEYHGQCETDFDEDGNALGHDISLTKLNSDLLCHEAAHAIANEQVTYEEASLLNPHGVLFQESLTTLLKALEEQDD